MKIKLCNSIAFKMGLFSIEVLCSIQGQGWIDKKGWANYPSNMWSGG